jgi:hypothetical protein
MILRGEDEVEVSDESEVARDRRVDVLLGKYGIH